MVIPGTHVASSFKPVDYQAQQCGIDLGYFAESDCTTALGSHEINSESSLPLGEWGRVEGSGVTEVGTQSASVSLRCQGVNAVTTRFDDSSLTFTPLPDNVLRFSPRAGNGLPRFAINGGSDPADEEAIEGVSAFPIGARTHVAVTLDSSACAVLPGCSEIVGTLYVNGTAVGSNPAMSLVPSKLGNTPLNFLGRSLFENADGPVFFDGSIDEFRIYNQALTADEIAVTFADGPDEP